MIKWKKSLDKSSILTYNVYLQRNKELDMFAPRDEKALFRKGAKVTCDFYGSQVFKITKLHWNADGSLEYTIEQSIMAHTGIKQKHLNKA